MFKDDKQSLNSKVLVKKTWGVLGRMMQDLSSKVSLGNMTKLCLGRPNKTVGHKVIYINN